MLKSGDQIELMLIEDCGQEVSQLRLSVPKQEQDPDATEPRQAVVWALQ